MNGAKCKGSRKRITTGGFEELGKSNTSGVMKLSQDMQLPEGMELPEGMQPPVGMGLLIAFKFKR